MYGLCIIIYRPYTRQDTVYDVDCVEERETRNEKYVSREPLSVAALLRPTRDTVKPTLL
jgi:hypothetical protein